MTSLASPPATSEDSAGAEDVFEHAYDDVLVDVGGAGRAVVTVVARVQIHHRGGDRARQGLTCEWGVEGRHGSRSPGSLESARMRENREDRTPGSEI